MANNNSIGTVPFSGTSRTPLPRPESGGLATLGKKVNKIARGVLGPATGSVEGLAALVNPNDIYGGLVESGENLKQGTLEADPLKLLLGAVGAATVVGENTPVGRATRPVNRVYNVGNRGRKPNPDLKAEWYGPDYMPLPEGPTKIAARKKDKDGILLDEDDNPIVVYHSTDSEEPFKEFNLKERGYPFLSTSTSPVVAGKFGRASTMPLDYKRSNLTPKEIQLLGYDPDESTLKAGMGARIIPGMVKANKTFDYENSKDVKEIVNNIKKEKKRRIKETLDDIDYKLSDKNIKEEFDKFADTPKDYKKKVKEYKENYINIRKMFLSEDNLDEVYVSSQEIQNIQDGGWHTLEDGKIQNILKELGYDSFTTYERGGKNIMLMNPKEQFIPLFDQEKTSKIGYKEGGSVVERNPYNYTAKAI